MNSLLLDTRSAHDFPDRGPVVFAVTTGTLVLASVFVGARLACRSFIVRQVSWDDYFIVIAWFLAFGLSFAIDYGATIGLGRHDVDIPAHNRDPLLRSEYAFTVLYNPALMAFKTSVLIFYLRLSKNTQKVLRLASWAVLIIVNLAGTVLTLLNIFQCNPVESAFNTDDTGQCIPLLAEFICSAPINIVTDLAILALPLPVLTGMRLPPRQKIILIMTFALGIFITVVDVVRIYYLQKAISDASSTFSGNLDPNFSFGVSPEFSWNASLALLWSAVEVNVGITCACIPTLKPLIIRILPAMLIDPDGSTRRASDTADVTPTVQSYRHESTAAAPNVTQDRNSTSSQAHGPESDVDAQISAMEFLTTPDMMLDRNHPPITNTTTATSLEASGVYFGFVNMRKPKSMIRTSVRDSFKYCTIVTILFLLWGFSYGLLNTLSLVVAQISHMTPPETIGLTSIYFGGGYSLGPLLVGEWILRHDEHRRREKMRRNSTFDDTTGGFKATFMFGLCIYGVGTIIFWPSAVLTSFPGYLISNFVVGFGLAVLETAANPFIALCGPMDYAEMRLCFAQGVQGVATVLSQLLAQKVFFVELSASESIGASTLVDVQWTFLAITLLCVGLALFFYYMPLPEVTDAELENSTRYLPIDPKKRSFFGYQLRTWTLVLAVVAQWTYVGGQETMSLFFHDILQPSGTSTAASGPTTITRAVTSENVGRLSISIDDFGLIARTAFALSRFLVAYLAYLSPTHPRVPQPRTILNICAGLSIVTGVVVSAIRPSNPDLLSIPIVLFYFFEGPIWPLIYTLGLRGQGSRTKRAAAFLTMGASGPAFWPFVVWGIHQSGASYQTAFVLVPALLVITGIFSLFLDLKHDARALVDARVGPEQQQRIQDRANHEMDLDAIIAARRRASVNGLGDPALDYEKASVNQETGSRFKRR
ncbi:fucose permease [Xylaria bambusicola]|uniref:fucose permease n=1 Tax=Xylaria bambusicola TaxID=326684 RepID=UPI0020086533|nr:fucose permease [Xylaria bambusicola]KAI0521775.1 fucose permease [Xylaria bambusicola]